MSTPTKAMGRAVTSQDATNARTVAQLSLARTLQVIAIVHTRLINDLCSGLEGNKDVRRLRAFWPLVIETKPPEDNNDLIKELSVHLKYLENCQEALVRQSISDLCEFSDDPWINYAQEVATGALKIGYVSIGNMYEGAIAKQIKHDFELR